MDKKDRDSQEIESRPAESEISAQIEIQETGGPEDRRRFLKGLIAGAAVASLAKPGMPRAEDCGRKLPFMDPGGGPSVMAFAQDLSVAGGIDPAQWDQTSVIMQQYLGPLVDTGNYLGFTINITIQSCLTISGT